MKKHFLILLALALFSCNEDDDFNISSDVFEGDYEIRSQEDLDSFAENGYKEIDGTLVVNYAYGVENLSGLSSLEKVDAIIIKYNADLISLEGLENISEVEFLNISNNVDLISLNGLNRLSKVENSLRIEHNYDLNSLEALNQLSEVGTQFFIANNDALTSFNGLENLTSVYNLFVLENVNLTDISAIDNINTSTGMDFSSNDSLYDFCALSDFIEQNPEPHIFAARFNAYNPTVEDILNGDCTE
ncbi:protein phosphatase 1 regulatory subunit 42 [Weeksellaceae bacterium KMM 9724]|uniref:hypothetical protein n=1 Tax=Profundicola chukchiensis TaxID=2961959 RepID=UPI0024397501|nr:hypothetical protein [Profundicola chukchiensis]MDG4951268.1 protein phosphatase 1 regulatory subunit 42 [Profundicola chukchiensis]